MVSESEQARQTASASKVDGAALKTLPRDTDGRPTESEEWRSAVEALEHQRAAESFDLNREVLYMCLKHRMTDAEGQQLLDLLHMLKNEPALLDTVTMQSMEEVESMAETHRAGLNQFLQKTRRQPLGVGVGASA